MAYGKFHPTSLILRLTVILAALLLGGALPLTYAAPAREPQGTNLPAVQNQPSQNGMRGLAARRPPDQSQGAPPCARPGWFPTDFGLKDHHVFRYGGKYYLVSIYLPDETRFAYARSDNLCNWEQLSTVLNTRTPGAWDAFRIWAPFVYGENGTYYLYYTGVTDRYTQSILLATSTNPADPASWQPTPMVFQPSHAGADWQAGRWADCRDPSMFKIDGIYYLFYTGLDASGGIVGLATADSPTGPWTDWGSILPQITGMYESPTLTRHGRFYYLFYHQVGASGDGEFYRIGASPAGPWGKPLRISPGLAHEIWKGANGEEYTSYLTDKSVSIAPLTWDTFFMPAMSVIGADVHHQFVPAVFRSTR